MLVKISRKYQVKKDEFYNKAEKFIEKCQKQMESLDKELADANKHYQNLAKFYGYCDTDTKYKIPEEFFNLISDFLNQIEKELPKNEQPKKNFSRKFEVGKKIGDGKVNQMEDISNELKGARFKKEK